SAEPALAGALLRRDRLDEVIEHGGESPPSRDVLFERGALVLRQHLDAKKSRVDEVREDDVDDAVTTAEGNGRLRSVERQRAHTFPLASGEDHREHSRTLVGRSKNQFTRHSGTL